MGKFKSERDYTCEESQVKVFTKSNNVENKRAGHDCNGFFFTSRGPYVLTCGHAFEKFF